MGSPYCFNSNNSFFEIEHTWGHTWLAGCAFATPAGAHHHMIPRRRGTSCVSKGETKTRHGWRALPWPRTAGPTPGPSRPRGHRPGRCNSTSGERLRGRRGVNPRRKSSNLQQAHGEKRQREGVLSCLLHHPLPTEKTHTGLVTTRGPPPPPSWLPPATLPGKNVISVPVPSCVCV